MSGPLSELFRSGVLEARVTPRTARAGVVLAHEDRRRFALRLGVDATGATSRRFEVEDDDGSSWALAELPAERFDDFAVHPSGEVTLALERLDRDAETYELRRFGRGGELLAAVVLPRPAVPATDLGAGLSATPFRMLGPRPGSLVKGWLPWLRVQPRGEDLVLAFETAAEREDGGFGDGALLLGVMSLEWTGADFAQRWARVVDGEHPLISIAWQYDKFLWLDAAMRPLLALTPSGEVVVGRSLTYLRCLVDAARFAAPTALECRTRVNFGAPHRAQAFAATRFDADGGRGRTTVFAPTDVEELVLFDMGLSPGGEALAVVGTAITRGDGGAPSYYFEPPADTSSTPLLPYDAELAVLDLETGEVRFERRLDLGRAEHLSAVRWTPEGLLAAGAAGWNRWYGGMSVSRGANPLLVLEPLDGGPALVRELSTADRTRHTHLLAVDVRTGGVSASGPADAPMTHSADADPAQLAIGAVSIELVPGPDAGRP